MSLPKFIFRCFGMIIFLAMIGCFPNVNVKLTERKDIAPDTVVMSPTKAFLVDASFIMFPTGIKVQKDSIEGEGIKIGLGSSDSKTKMWRLPLDSVAAVTSYAKEMSFGRFLASELHGVLGSVMTPLSLYCLICPKCCFGSCPTVYTHDGTTWHLEAELFSSSISKLLEDHDTDLLSQKVASNGFYQMRLTNEALETHYINKLSVEAVYHPIGTKLYLSERGVPVIMKNLVQPLEVTSRSGSDVLNLVRSTDSLHYRSDLAMFTSMMYGVNYDWLEVHTTVPVNVQKVKMLIRMRNTLMSTILLYDVVLASQGISALNWIERMNTDPVYASKFREVYNAFSGMKVLVKRDSTWVPHSSLIDAGPISWKYIVAEIPVGSDRNLQLRLQFVPDNVMIDFIGFDYEEDIPTSLAVEKLRPLEIRDSQGLEKSDLEKMIEQDDDQYLITEPGESYRFVYQVPQKKDLEATILIRSKGYYVEWIRGSWLKRNHSNYRFDLANIDQTFGQLAFSWITNKELMERTFFETRIPVMEVP